MSSRDEDEAWRQIVANYGDAPSVEDVPGPRPRRPRRRAAAEPAAEPAPASFPWEDEGRFVPPPAAADPPPEPRRLAGLVRSLRRPAGAARRAGLRDLPARLDGPAGRRVRRRVPLPRAPRCRASHATRATTGRASDGRAVGSLGCGRECQRERRDHRPPDGQRHPVARPGRHPRVRRGLGHRADRRRPRGRRHRPPRRSPSPRTTTSSSSGCSCGCRRAASTMVDPGEAECRVCRPGRRLPRRLLLHHQPADPDPPRGPR